MYMLDWSFAFLFVLDETDARKVRERTREKINAAKAERKRQAEFEASELVYTICHYPIEWSLRVCMMLCEKAKQKALAAAKKA
jgi:phosphoribosyl-ATP pyrophosphohydrolase